MKSQPIVKITIDAEKFRASFGQAALPEQGNAIGGDLLSPPRPDFLRYVIVWPVNPSTPFEVTAAEIDLRHRSVHDVSVDATRYFAELGEKPRVGHIVAGSVFTPEKGGFYAVVSVRHGGRRLLVERRCDIVASPRDVIADTPLTPSSAWLLHSDTRALSDDAGYGVDDITQYECDPAEFNVGEPDSLLEYEVLSGAY